MKNLLSKEALLSKSSLQVVEVPLKDGIVCIREMSGLEKDTWEQSLMKTAPNGNPNASPQVNYDLKGFRAKLAVMCLCDELGVLLFSIKDAPALNEAMRASDLEAVVNKAQEINGISEKDKEGMLKNLEADQQDNSTSNSAVN